MNKKTVFNRVTVVRKIAISVEEKNYICHKLAVVATVKIWFMPNSVLLKSVSDLVLHFFPFKKKSILLMDYLHSASS